MESIHRKDSLFSSVWALIKDGNASISGGSPLVLLSLQCKMTGNLCIGQYHFFNYLKNEMRLLFVIRTDAMSVEGYSPQTAMNGIGTKFEPI